MNRFSAVGPSRPHGRRIFLILLAFASVVFAATPAMAQNQKPSDPLAYSKFYRACGEFINGMRLDDVISGFNKIIAEPLLTKAELQSYIDDVRSNERNGKFPPDGQFGVCYFQMRLGLPTVGVGPVNGSAAGNSTASASARPSDPAAYAGWRQACGALNDKYMGEAVDKNSHGTMRGQEKKDAIDNALVDLFNQYNALPRPAKADLQQAIEDTRKSGDRGEEMGLCYIQFRLGVPAVGLGTAPTGGNPQVALNAPNKAASNTDAQNNAKPPKQPGVPAHNCLTLLTDSGFGGFQNKCDFKVFVSYCAYRPKKGAWNEMFDCEQQKGGFDWVQAGSVQAAHTNGTRMYWFACKDPSWPTGTRFVPGQGIVGRCG